MRSGVGSVALLAVALGVACGSSSGGAAPDDAGTPPVDAASEATPEAGPEDAAPEAARDSGVDAIADAHGTGDAGQVPWPPPLPSGATDYYVSPTGSDSNDGSAAHPWLTIAHAAKSITGGSKPITVSHIFRPRLSR